MLFTVTRYANYHALKAPKCLRFCDDYTTIMSLSGDKSSASQSDLELEMKKIMAKAAPTHNPADKALKPFLLAGLVLAALIGFSSQVFAYSEGEGKLMYKRGLYQEAIEHWKRAAAAGDAGAAYQVAVEYFDAKVVERDLGVAIKYLKQAAEADDPRALTELAAYYDYGTGVNQDLEKAAQLYLRAAQYGIPSAMLNIAAMLASGEGIAQDKVEAYKFYELSSHRGFHPFASKAMQDLSVELSPTQLADALERAENFVPGDF